MLLRLTLIEEEERKDALEIAKIQDAIMRREIPEQEWWDMEELDLLNANQKTLWTTKNSH